MNPLIFNAATLLGWGMLTAGTWAQFGPALAGMVGGGALLVFALGLFFAMSRRG